MMTARKFKISGRVQGVGYRFFLTRYACSSGLTGWIRNETDGTVSVVIEGPDFRLDQFEDALRRGPPGARIEEVEKEVIPAKGEFQRFQILESG